MTYASCLVVHLGTACHVVPCHIMSCHHVVQEAFLQKRLVCHAMSSKSHLTPGPWLKQYHLGSVFVCRVVMILEREP